MAEVIAALEAAGLDLDEADRRWLAGIAAAAATPGEFVVAADEGIGGHELALLDFDPADAAALRRLGRVIAVPAAPDIRTALAVAGSAAQGRIQPYPADIDFFERVHVLASTREAAQRRLAELVRSDALRIDSLPGFDLEELYFGRLPAHLTDASRGDLGLAWTLADVVAGTTTVGSPADGPPMRLSWDEAAADPGFVKLDWFVIDPAFGGPARVSKVVDATWEGPDGTVVGLDGRIDVDAQQVYLDAAAAALAERLTRALAAGDRERYLRAMEREVAIHARRQPPDFVKVTKRLYNLCRLSGRYAEALALHDLLAEPPARLHQTRAVLKLIARAGASDPPHACADLVALLDDLTDPLGDDPACLGAVASCRAAAATPTADGLRAALLALDAALAERVNAAFRSRLHAHAPIAALLAEIEARHSQE